MPQTFASPLSVRNAILLLKIPISPPSSSWANGRLHLLLSSYGVVRLDGDELTQMTPAWPRGARGEQLILEDDTAIIATASSGVLLWKLGTTEARRVELAG